MRIVACARLSALALLVVACTESGSVTGPVAESAVSESIRRLGFNPQSLVEAGDYYIVEGDIAIPKSALERQADDTTGKRGVKPNRQYFTDTLVSASSVSHIKLDLSQISNDAAWLSAMRTAMANWNSLPGTTVTFVEESPADIVVKLSNLGCDVGGAAVFPTGNPGKAGPVVWLSTAAQWCLSFNQFVTPTASQRLRVATHELGHAIGFRHTDWQGNEPQYGQPFMDPDGTTRYVAGANAIATTTDGASIMNRGLGASWGGFSHFDSLAATIYNGMIVVETNEAGHPKVAVTIPRGSLSIELRLVTHHREYNDNFVLVYSESSDLVESTYGSNWPLEYTYVDQLNTWGYTGCSTYSDFPYPEEWKDWQIIVQYPQGPVYAGVAAHVMSSSGWQECH
jgi:hypothetical protein